MDKKSSMRFLSVSLLFILLFTNFMPLMANADAMVSQGNTRFPEEEPTSRIFARDRQVFKGYEGKGHILIENYGVESAEVYINGNEIKVDEVLKEKHGKRIFDIGEYTVNGDNTIKVLNVEPEGTYLDIHLFYPKIGIGNPEDVGFSNKKLAEIDDFINKEVEEGFPGAVLLVLKDGKIVKNTAYGYKLKYDGEKLLDEFQPMDPDTIFDLASNTKMYATNIAIQKLVSEGKLDVNKKVIDYIPGFTGDTRENIKVKDLLNHTAGFAASIKFYMPDNPLGEEFFSHDREKTLELLEKAPLEYETGTKTIYSDTDYMLLGYIIENITGQRLDEYVEENIYKPLGLKNTKFLPLEKGFTKDEFAATETLGNTRGGERDFPNIRKHTLQGEAHDEKAFYSMGGVSGHAGLFSTTKDLAVLCQTILNHGGYGNTKLFDGNVLDQFTKPSDNSITFGLGWDRAGNMDKVWQFGPYASNLAVGHTGWTGTLTVIDPKHDMAIVLLTNKKHSKFEDGKFEGDDFQTGLYGSIVSLVYEALLENN
ncbi:penicillin binding protein PBP4B [Tissierella sp. MSJ-40]|uniref:Penicillin binding protein PBP4B n=1 Tax=Tissierella simiarum TaxID=2841534 RepID=A0ABS6E1X9_9FIRM|nr:penicillin binding protein PBP4B [Tissierella simiarum]MBU5436904.1 penicillin binding protein PBP4B [Tissierella simiarum]